VLPFWYADGSCGYVASCKPVTVVLAAGATAYVLVAKYRCDRGIARNAAAIRLAMRAAGGRVFDAREAVGLPGPQASSYIPAGSAWAGVRDGPQWSKAVSGVTLSALLDDQVDAREAICAQFPTWTSGVGIRGGPTAGRSRPSP
jgi:hypothetical protein